MHLCQVCQKKPVTKKITRLVDGTPTEYTVCDDCAPTISPHVAKLKEKKASKTTVEHLLQQLLAHEGDGANRPGGELADDPTCPDCGLGFSRYRQTLMLGCPGCYEGFADRLLDDIRKIQGTTEHIADAPPPRQRTLADAHARLAVLRRELEQSIASEDFARAASVRDEIRRLNESLAVPAEG